VKLYRELITNESSSKNNNEMNCLGSQLKLLHRGRLLLAPAAVQQKKKVGEGREGVWKRRTHASEKQEED
jgi:hypothetical protein